MLAAVVLLLVVAGEPDSATGDPGRAGFPLSWLSALLTPQRAIAAPPVPPTPQQQSGTAAGRLHYVGSSTTKAGGGHGKAPGKGVGELGVDVPHDPAAAGKVTTPPIPGRFDRLTSKRVASASTAVQDMYQNADGSYTRRLHEKPVNFRRADGSWTPIDTQLRSRADGRLAQAANGVAIDVAPNTATADLVSIELDANRRFAYGIADVGDVKAVVSGPRAVYPAIQPGVDLQLDTLADGVKETLILHSAGTPTSWVFPLHLQGLTALIDTDGSVSLVDGSGTVAGSIPSGYMWDANVDPLSGESPESRGVHYSLTTDGGTPALRLSIDADWLADPARVFPVKIDPTFNYLGTSATTYAHTQNAGNNSGKTVMKVGTSDGGSTIKAAAYLKFDGFSNVFANTHVTSATLNLFDAWAYNCSNTHTWYVNRVTAAWTAAGVVSYPGPAYDSDHPIGSSTEKASPATCTNNDVDPTIGTWMHADISGATFDDWVRGGANNGLAVTASLTDSTAWKQFASRNTVNPPYLDVNYTINTGPTVSSQYPADNANVPTLTPELMASATDSDNWPGGALSYDFVVHRIDNGTASQVADSGWIPTGSWVVPSGALSWGKTYRWAVTVRDGGPAPNDVQATVRTLSTPVAQPLITSNLAQNGGHGFNPAIGNYTMAATDADIATVGPALTIARQYNSRDPRTDLAFGTGWSTLLDAKVAEQYSTGANPAAVTAVVVTYPEGQDVAFGRNADGKFVSPEGRFSTLTPIAGVPGGYVLLDKNGTAFRFDEAGVAYDQAHQRFTDVRRLGSVTDGAGRKLTLAYSSGRVSSVTSASGRSLQVNWSTPAGAVAAHVATVVTDPVTPGNSSTATTWTYSYTGDQLTKVCSPASMTACSTYDYTSTSQFPTAALDGNPKSYWRLNDPLLSTTAANAAPTSGGADVGQLHEVALGVPGALPGSPSKSASFNGSSSYMEVTSGLVTAASYQTVSLWFKTSTPNGVLFSYQLDPITNSTTGGNYTPSLYIGSDRKLHGEFWYAGGVQPIVSASTVTDDQWHHVVLSGAGNTQTLYLDGTSVDSRDGQLQLWTEGGSRHVYVGAGFLGGAWPDQANYHPGDNSANATFFNGSISDVAFYDRSLSGYNVATLYAAGHNAAKVLTGARRPSGQTFATVGYDLAAGTVTQVTDDAGGTWSIGTPVAAGPGTAYASAVQGGAPIGYWRLDDANGPTARNQLIGPGGAYNSATLGDAGPFAGSTAATFNGTTSYVQLPTTALPPSGALTLQTWFKTTSTAGGALIGTGHPALLIGTDGKLRGATPLSTSVGPLNQTSLGKCLDDWLGGTGDGNSVVSYPCLGGVPQSWTAMPDGTFRNQGKCLDVSGYGTANGSKVYLWTCHGGANQIWQVYNGGLRNPVSGRCLEVPNATTADATQVQIWDCHGGASQTWSLAMTSANAVNDGAWHQATLTVTADTNTQALYLDGQLVQSSQRESGYGPIDGSALYAGQGSSAAGWSGGLPVNVVSHLSGSLADVAVYRTALTASTIGMQYAIGKSSVSLTPTSTVTVTDPGANHITYTYDVLGGMRTLARVDGLGNRSTYGYDTSGFLHTVTDPNGIQTITGHDVRGNTVSRTTCENQASAACSTAYYTYYPDATTQQLDPDLRNDLMLTSRDPRSASATDNTYLTTFGYDAKGNLTSLTTPPVSGWPNGRTTTMTYTDGMTTAAVDGGLAPPGLLTTSTSAAGAVQQLSYYRSGSPARVTDATGQVTDYTYDGLGRIASRTYGWTGSGSSQVSSYSTATVSKAFTPADTPLALTGDDVQTQITLPFGVNLYGQTYTSAWVSTNGELSFAAQGADDASTTLPSANAPNGAVYPFWTDLVTDSSSAILTKTTGTAPNRQFILEWRNSALFGSAMRVSTEIVYDEATATFVTNYTGIDPAQSRERGGEATIGIENSDGSAATMYSHNTAVLADDTAIVFTPVTNGQQHATTAFTYDELGRVSTVRMPSVTNRVTGAVHTPQHTTVYDDDGNITAQSVTDLTGGDASRTTTFTYSGYNRPHTITTPTGTTTIYTYDTYGRQVSTIDPHGEIAFAYDANGHQLEQRLRQYTGDPNQPSNPVDLVLSSRAYDPGGRLASVTDTMGRTTAYTYFDNGRVATVTHSGNGSSFATENDTYDQAGNLTKQTTGNGTTTTTMVYDASNRLTSSTVDPAGLARTTTYSYSADDKMLSAVGGGGRSEYTYNASGDLTSASTVDPTNGANRLTTTWVVDQRGLNTSMTDPKGNVTTYEYDEAGQNTVIVLPAVNTETGGGAPVLAHSVLYQGYDTFGAVTQRKDANGATTTLGYDADGRLITTTGAPYTPPGATTAIVPVVTQHYDSHGLVDWTTDPLGNKTTYSHDQLGNVSKVIAPDLAESKSTYDLNGEPLSATGPTGAVTQATYDYLGRIKTTTQIVRQPSTSAYTTTFVYDDTSTGGGWLKSTTSPAGVTTSRTYNRAGQPLTAADGAGNPTTYAYDTAGRSTDTTLADGSRSRRGYDAFGRLNSAQQFAPNGTLVSTATVGYDATGNVVSATDPLGTTVTSTYDATNMLVSQNQPITTTSSITTTFGYDANGNRTRYTDGRGNPFITTYNGWGLPENTIEPATIQHPNTGDRTFTTAYDGAGRTVTQFAPGGVTTTNTYDVAGQVIQQTGGGAETATATRTFGYDPAGHLTSATVSGGTDTFTYDDRGLLLTATGVSGNSSFAYTPDGLTASRTDTAGTATYAYDAADRLSTLADPATGNTLTYAYNNLNLPSSITYGAGGNVRTFGYAPNHDIATDTLKTPGNVTIASIGYQYDANGNLKQKTTSGFAGSATNIYTYDLAQRLSSWSNNGAMIGYTYDDSGNRLTAGAKTFTYNQRNELTGDGSHTYAYTARGTLSDIVGSGGSHAVYDAYGQAISRAGTSYNYDGLGRVLGAAGQPLAYTGLGNTVASDGAATYSRDPGGNLVGTKAAGPGVQAWTDRHSDVVGQFTAGGTVLSGSSAFDPLGGVIATSSTTGQLGFQSGWTDTGSGQVNMAARWYNPATGQFDSRDSWNLDPTADHTNGNRYAYVNDNPLNRTDQSGHVGVGNPCTNKTNPCNPRNWAPGYHPQPCCNIDPPVVVPQCQGTSWYDCNYGNAGLGEADPTAKPDPKDPRKPKTGGGSRPKKTSSRNAKPDGGLISYHPLTTVSDASPVAQTVADIPNVAVCWDNCDPNGNPGGGPSPDTSGAGFWFTHWHVEIHDVLDALAWVPVVGGFADILQHDYYESQGDQDTADSYVWWALADTFGDKILGKIGSWVFRGGKWAFEKIFKSAVKDAERAAENAAKDAAKAAEDPHVKTDGEGGPSGTKDGGGTTDPAGGNGGGKTEAGGGGEPSRGADAGPPAAGAEHPGGLACTVPHSFAPDTRVLTASGTTKEIKDLEVGEQIAAADPHTGETGSEPITAVHVNRDTELSDLTIRDGTGHEAVIHTTAHHPFYDDTAAAWVDADSLMPGHQLRAVGGWTAVVLAVSNHRGDREMIDLTVAAVHTYYVLAGEAPVLVHNCDLKFVYPELLMPGPYAPAWFFWTPALSKGNQSEFKELVRPAWKVYGCHSCGGRGGEAFVGDHILPGPEGLTPEGIIGYTWLLMPQCRICSDRQSKAVIRARTILRNHGFNPNSAAAMPAFLDMWLSGSHG